MEDQSNEVNHEEEEDDCKKKEEEEEFENDRTSRISGIKFKFEKYTSQVQKSTRGTKGEGNKAIFFVKNARKFVK